MTSLSTAITERSGGINKSWVAFFILWSFQLALGAIWLYLNSGEFSSISAPESSTFITYDALLYRSRAIEFAQNYNLFDITSLMSFISFYGFNYSVISILGSLAQMETGFNDWYIFFFNSALLAVAYQTLSGLLRSSGVKPYGVIVVLALFLYIPFSLIQLNKEIVGFVFIVLMMSALHKRSRLGLFLLCVTFGLVRTQYFIMALILIFFPRPRLFLLLLFINLAVYVAIPPSLAEWGERLESIGASSNTLGLMLMVDALAYIPIVGLLGYLCRILLSLITGLFSPIKIIVDSIHGQPVDFIYHSSIFMLSILAAIAAYQYYQVKKQELKVAPIFYTNLYIFVVFCSVNSIAPFLQPRYNLPLILPLVVNQVIFQFAKKQQKKSARLQDVSS